MPDSIWWSVPPSQTRPLARPEIETQYFGGKGPKVLGYPRTRAVDNWVETPKPPKSLIPARPVVLSLVLVLMWIGLLYTASTLHNNELARLLILVGAGVSLFIPSIIMFIWPTSRGR